VADWGDSVSACYTRGSNCPDLYPCICSSMHPFINTFVRLWTQYCENERTGSDANWHKWSMGQGHDLFDFWRQEVKAKVT